MKTLTSRTNGWLAAGPPPLDPADARNTEDEDAAIAEAKRALSDVLLCTNLVVLSGLGTSLCVHPSAPGGATAPTMRDLWVRVQIQQDAAALAMNPADPTFFEILNLVGHPAATQDIEALLSRCRLAEAFLSGGARDAVVRFIALAEKTIIEATNFVTLDHPLPVHTEFLRRIARRSQRKSRAKIFTTNYDRCFEEAGRQGRYVVIDGFSQTVPPTFDAIHYTYETVRRVGDTESFDPIPNLFHLYKLHGSVDWQRHEPSGEVMKWTAGGKPVLIYPRNTKYELAFEQPYLEMIGAFQSALREPDTGVLVTSRSQNRPARLLGPSIARQASCRVWQHSRKKANTARELPACAGHLGFSISEPSSRAPLCHSRRHGRRQKLDAFSTRRGNCPSQWQSHTLRRNRGVPNSRCARSRPRPFGWYKRRAK